MANHFKWILTCLDDSSTYTLTNDPIGYESCTYKLERHKLYKGIFNEFTSKITFHNDGGGKQFIDAKYQTYDINGQITIEVQVDVDGRGIVYETLFTGIINLASYESDTIHTKCNIERSDLAAKLNTRADIPVPINVPVIEVEGQPAFKAVIVAQYIPEEHNGIRTGTFIFNNPQIEQGKIYRVVTTDINNDAVIDSLTFTANGLSGPGAISGDTELQITNISTGSIEVTFADIYDSITLLQIGEQVSLGQQTIQPVNTQQISLPGIPMVYQSDFKMSGNINSGSHTFTNAKIVAGHTITIYATGPQGGQVSDTVVYTGTDTPGAGGQSADTTIQITSITTGQVIVAYANTYAALDLWIDGDFTQTFTPTGSAAVQTFTIPAASISSGTIYRGFMSFDAGAIFDNLNEFVFGSFSDFAQNGSSPNVADTLLPPVYEGFDKPYIDYPVTVNYRIRLKGSFTQAISTGAAIHRLVTGGLSFACGETLATATVTTLQSLSAEIFLASNTQAFDIDVSGTLTLGKDDKIWLYSFWLVNPLEGAITANYDLEWNFEESLLTFEVIENALPTTMRGVLIHEAFTQVADMIGDSDNNLYSSFYGRTNSQKRTYAANGEGSLRLITNGLCVRGRLDKYISTSLNQLFMDMAAIDNIGMEIDALNRLRIEKLEHFFDKDTKIATLDRVYNYNTLNENSLYYNQVEAGYEKFDTEIYFKNGLDEVHGKRSYGTKVGKAKGTNFAPQAGLNATNKLSLVSKLVAGNYAIELTRRKNKEWSQDDFKYDSDNFIFCLTNTIPINASFSLTHLITFRDRDLQYMLKTDDTITIAGSASNNGTFTVDNVTFNGTHTLVTVVETLTTEAITAITLTAVGYVAERASDVLDGGITNIFRPTLATGWLNMAITPARMLQSNMNHVTAGLQKIKGNVQFLNGEGNYLATTKFLNNGTTRQQDYNFYTLGENSSISTGDGNVRNITPLWVPEIYRFEYPLTYVQFKAIRANPNGYIEFWKFEDEVKKGFILSMDYNLQTGLTKFELLKVYDPEIILAESEDARAILSENEFLIETVNIVR